MPGFINATAAPIRRRPTMAPSVSATVLAERDFHLDARKSPDADPTV